MTELNNALPIVRTWRALRARWSTWSPFRRHWLINILLGILIEIFVHFGGHSLHLQPIVSFQNWGLDVMTRLNAEAPSASTPVLVNIDAQTWRSADWGGGEPSRAPREKLLALVDRSFQLGAVQVVLDVLVEDGGGLSAVPATDKRALLSLAEDQAFADGLNKLLSRPYFGADRKLILVRSVREPWPFQVDMLAYLGEMRRSAAVDAVVANSNGRIVVAAPYFVTDRSRVTRDWELFKVACERDAVNPDAGTIRVVPSVQLVIAAHLHSVQLPLETGNMPCTPFSMKQPAAMPAGNAYAQACLHALAIEGPSAAADHSNCKLARQLCGDARNTADYGNFPVCPTVLGQLEATEKALKTKPEHDTRNAHVGHDGLIHAYWNGVQHAFPVSARLGALPEHGGVGNRIVFKYSAESIETGMSTLRASTLLENIKINGFDNKVVVIGQTYQETGDFFNTPVGRMPGAMLLINAIDSMATHGLMKPPSIGLTLFVALVLIVLVGYLFARWDSSIGATLAVLGVVATVGVASHFLFAHGVWFDFAAPIIGIQLHQWAAALEERLALKRLTRLHGSHH